MGSMNTVGVRVSLKGITRNFVVTVLSPKCHFWNIFFLTFELVLTVAQVVLKGVFIQGEKAIGKYFMSVFDFTICHFYRVSFIKFA